MDPAERSPVRLRVPFTAASVPAVRAQLRQWLIAHGYHQLLEDARLIVSELVGNSVRHARPLPDGTLQVVWCLDGNRLTVSVTDGGSATTPNRMQVDSAALAGRGIAIVDTLAAQWWAERTRSCSTVHAVLPLP